MILSIWRYSHYLLAVLAGLFIGIASLTGIILAFEPINEKTLGYGESQAENYSLGQTVYNLQQRHDEVFSLRVDQNGFVLANLTTKNGESGDFYINPTTGEMLGEPEPKAPIFEFATNLHRSLFLKSTGRFIVGLASFLLLLILISGVILVIKRQGGLKKSLSKVVYENASSYYHVVLSRWTFIPILIICISGVILSLDRFSVLAEDKLVHKAGEFQKDQDKIPVEDFEIFKQYSIQDISSLEFPFSPFEEDHFILKTPTEELYIHQFHGGIISQAEVPAVTQLVDWSLILHTGQGSILWSVVLGLSCIVILVLMFTGYKMAYNRLRKSTKFKNIFKADNAEYILLVGSETGSTFTFAHRFARAMIKAGQSIYVDAMGNLGSYKKAKHLIIFTSTYGEGDAPVNAKDFSAKLHQFRSNRSIDFSVVGFGSMAYPDYCQYAIEVDQWLLEHKKFEANLPLHKINNQSEEAFRNWVGQWNERQPYDLKIESVFKKIKGLQNFEVTAVSALNRDDTYLIKLKPKKKINFTSGDLLSFYPKEDQVERQYSVAKVGDDILLSIKKHEFGVCSNFLYSLKSGSIVKAKLKSNSDFHLPDSAKEVIMISNGTGIAPFLGMISERSAIKKHLFWGGRTKESLHLYEDYLNSALRNNTLASLKTSFSREGSAIKYVQDLIQDEKKLFVETIKNDGVIMICGSIAMQNKVLEVLEKFILHGFSQPLQHFINNGQLKMDCY
jgi:sulfite reductase (NADPH) flavoprotein alpha-component